MGNNMGHMANTGNDTARAWVDQLKAEIAVSEYKSVAKFAAALDMEYYTFRRYLAGQRDIPFWVLMDSLAKLGLTFTDFETRVQARLQTKPAESQD